MYDYKELVKLVPELSEHITKDGELIYSSTKAVRLLNCALFLQEYNLKVDLPEGHLCPTVPNRTEYIRQIEFILRTIFSKTDPEMVGIDIGTGVSCVYPLIACARNPKWTFLATDIDDETINYARKNIESNKEIIGDDRITLIKNDDATCIFPPVLLQKLTITSASSDKFVICNPPFYTNTADLNSRRAFKRHKPTAGRWEMSESELGTDLGGEIGFIKKMIDESYQLLDKNVCLFSCMLGMKESLEELINYLNQQTAPVKYFAYNLLQISHTCRYLLFWSFTDKFPKDSSHRLKITAKTRRVQSITCPKEFRFGEFIKDLQLKYGSSSQLANSKNILHLTHNKWSRKYRRSPSAAPPLPHPIEITIEHEFENGSILFYPDDEVDWEIFLGFINHLRKEYKK